MRKSRSTPPPPETPQATPRSSRDWWICIALLLATLAVYAQTTQFDFVNFDDPDYVTANPHVRSGLSWDGIVWAVTSGDAANWFPVTRLSHLMDVQLFGMRSGGHHLTSVLLHSLAAILLFLFLRRATGARWRSAFVAAIFAVHPLHAESVAWVSERKDVLNAVFWFLTLWAYVRFTERPELLRYLLVVAAFCLGVMSKPMIVTLPFVLFLLDRWPLRRRNLGITAIVEKAPLLAIAAVSALVTYNVQHSSGAVRELTVFPLAARLQNALEAYVLYLAQTFMPVRMAAFYPYPANFQSWQVIGAAAALVIVTLLVWRLARAHPYLPAGWFWFLGTLVPVIGLVQVGVQSRADRYMYVPMVGLLIAIAWGGAEVLERWPRARAALAIAAVVCCVPLALAQVSYWSDSESLWRHALDVGANSEIAEHNLGSALLDNPARLQEAIGYLRAALRINGDSARAHTDLGSALAKSGHLDEAVAEFRAALAIEPQSAIVHNNLGNALGSAGRWGSAVEEYQAALRIEPEYADARRNLAIAQQQMAGAHFEAGVAAANAGRTADAIAELQESVRIAPENPEAQNNLGVVLSQVPGRLGEAVQHFEAALRLKPDYEDAVVNLQMARGELAKGKK